MEKRWIKITIVCIIILLSGNSGQAIELNPELAKELLAPGWEFSRNKEYQPIVIYFLGIMEIDSSQINVLDGEYCVFTEIQDPWILTYNEDLLSLISTPPKIKVVGLHGGEANKKIAFDYTTWLITLVDEPVVIDLKEDIINRKLEEQELSFFQLSMTPNTLDGEGQAVFTEVTLSYYNHTGALALIEDSLWIKQEFDQPIAILTQRVARANTVQNKYFALYLGARVISREDLPREFNLVPIGNIGGLEKLFTRAEKEVLPSELGFDFILGGDLIGWKGSFSTPLGCSYSIYGEVEYDGWQTRSLMGLQGQIHDYLGMEAQIETGKHIHPLLRLGVSDQTIWGDQLTLKAAYLPLLIPLTESRIIFQNHLLYEIKYHKGRWAVWYGGLWTGEGWTNKLALGLTSQGQLGYHVIWEIKPKLEHIFKIGITGKWF
jgi:hypothetical protein